MITVYFDGDQTLWDFQALMRRTLDATIDEMRRLRPGLVGDLGAEAFVADRDDAARAPDLQGASLEAVRRAGFACSLGRLGVPDEDGTLTDHLTRFYLARRWSGVDLYDDAVPALMSLAALPGRCRVGLLTNGNSYPDRVGLGHLFDAVVVAQDVGAVKPDPAIYAHAAARLPADRYVMVGDSLTDDVAGAQAAGWLGVWLDRGAGPRDATIKPDLTVTSLTDVVAWVAAIDG